VVVVVVVELVSPPVPTDAGSPPEVGALYSESSSALLQPGSDRSTSPSPSSSERFEQGGRTLPPLPPLAVVVVVLAVVVLAVVVLAVVVSGTLTCTSPDVVVREVALPAAIIARAPPRATVRRSFLVIWLADVARGRLGVALPASRTRRHSGRY
jgi:hypothetical protein